MTRLLGLRQGAFCSTVLLPQGQFATLLQAAAGVQKETLDAFFRLAEVTEWSDRLVAAAATLASRRREVEAVRDQLPRTLPPWSSRRSDRLREADQRRDAADELAEVVALHEKDAADAATRAETARQRAAELVKGAGALDEVAVRAGRLEALAIELTSAEQALTERTNARLRGSARGSRGAGLLSTPLAWRPPPPASRPCWSASAEASAAKDRGRLCSCRRRASPRRARADPHRRWSPGREARPGARRPRTVTRPEDERRASARPPPGPCG